MEDREHRIILTVEINLDPLYGAMHTRRSAETIVQQILDQRLGQYHPKVTS